MRNQTDIKDTYSHLLNNTAFGSAYKQLKNVNPVIFRQKKPPGNNPHYSLNILFEGEHVEGILNSG
jgi:hypothetical protein